MNNMLQLVDPYIVAQRWYRVVVVERTIRSYLVCLARGKNDCILLRFPHMGISFYEKFKGRPVWG